MKQSAASTGSTAKHAGTAKQGGTRKHAPAARKPAAKKAAAKSTTVAKQPAHAKPRQLAGAVLDQGGAQRGLLRLCPARGGEAEPRQLPGAPPCLDARALDDVACCSALAVAMSLRLAGGCVGADDVEALYWATAADPDAGASIWATLEAAAASGLAGHRFRSVLEARPGGLGIAGRAPDPSRGADRAGAQFFPPVPPPEVPHRSSVQAAVAGQDTPLILGLELPGPHAVLAVGDTWWSWGRPWHRSAFPNAVVEEAWAVSWS